MGPRHSKRSLDMAGTPTKSEIEGVGNVGKLEKIVDGVVEKVATNGHVEGELQNGAEPLHNGLEQVQNGDASVVVSENSIEKLKIDEKEKDEVINSVNGETEEKINGETEEKLESDGKDDKKDKKKDKKEDKKEKVVKKKFSFRSFSFSKKDKSKPKEEKVSDAQTKAGIEESPEGAAENAEPIVEESKEVKPEPIVPEKIELAIESKESTNIVPPAVTATVNAAISEVVVETNVASTADKIPTTADDLPPPLPASPPPTDVKEEVITQVKKETIIKEEEYPQPENITVINKETEETTNDVLTATEQIEEKATDLLKTVEEKVEECKRKESEGVEDDEKPDDEVAPTEIIEVEEDVNVTMVDEAASKAEESVVNNMSNIVTMSPSAEDSSDKQEEFGAGESLAEMDMGPEETSTSNEVVVME